MASWRTKADIVHTLVTGASLWERAAARFRPVDLGKYTPLGYSASVTFYLFTCKDCGKLSADHMHGRRRLYCHHCNLTQNRNPY